MNSDLSISEEQLRGALELSASMKLLRSTLERLEQWFIRRGSSSSHVTAVRIWPISDQVFSQSLDAVGFRRCESLTHVSGCFEMAGSGHG